MMDRLRGLVEELGELGLLTRDFLRHLLRRPFEIRLLLEQVDSVGVRSLNVVNLTAILTGMVLALHIGLFLAKFGAKLYVSRIMGLSLMREMGPVLTALMIGARVGAEINRAANRSLSSRSSRVVQGSKRRRPESMTREATACFCPRSDRRERRGRRENWKRRYASLLFLE